MTTRGLIGLAGVTLVVTSTAFARDLGQWEATDADVAKWFRDLKQPDAPNMSCCGQADAYFADSFEVNKTGQTIATVTDTRDDGPLGRPHIKPGTKIIVPDYKMKYDEGNPTGHGVIFVRWDDDNAIFGVLCYITPGGV